MNESCVHIQELEVSNQILVNIANLKTQTQYIQYTIHEKKSNLLSQLS